MNDSYFEMNSDVLVWMNKCDAIEMNIDVVEDDEIEKLLSNEKRTRKILTQCKPYPLTQFTLVKIMSGCRIFGHFDGFVNIQGDLVGLAIVSGQGLERDPDLNWYIDQAGMYFWLAEQNGFTMSHYQLEDRQENKLKTLTQKELSDLAKKFDARIPKNLAKYTAVSRIGSEPNYKLCPKCPFADICYHKD